MNIEVDQFGRNTNQPSINNSNDERSKKILDSLSEIKEQLQNKNFSPKSETNISPSKKNLENSNFEELNKRLFNLEKRLIELNNKLELNDENHHNFHPDFDDSNDQKSIFSNFENNSITNVGKSLLVLDGGKEVYVSKFKFYHFVVIFAVMSGALILLTSIKLGLSINQIIKIFLNNF